MELDPIELAAVAAVYLAAGAVKGMIGLGLPTISMALLSIWLPVEQAAAILVIPAFLTNIWQSTVGGEFKALLIRLWPMLLFLVAGTLATAGVMVSANTAVTGAFLGAILAAYAGLALAGFQPTVKRRWERVLGPSTGFTTGLISGATGIFVIPAAPYVQALVLSKNGLVQAIGITALTASAALALGLGLNDSLTPSVAIPGTIAVVTAFAGMAAGQALRDRVSVEVFRRWVLIGLVALGAAMILRAL